MRVTWEMVQKRTSVTSSCCAGHTPTPHSFFFHAEDGIRDGRVTGVQTCALPISSADGPPGSRGGVRLELATVGEREREDRKSVVKGKSVALGGRRITKKKIN